MKFNLEEFINGRVAYTDCGEEVHFLLLLKNPNEYKRYGVKIIGSNTMEILDTCSETGYLFNSQMQLYFKPKTKKITTVYYILKENTYREEKFFAMNFDCNEDGRYLYRQFTNKDKCEFYGRKIVSTMEVEVPIE